MCIHTYIVINYYSITLLRRGLFNIYFDEEHIKPSHKVSRILENFPLEVFEKWEEGFVS